MTTTSSATHNSLVRVLFLSARVATVLLALALAKVLTAAVVDPALVGTWQVLVPNPRARPYKYGKSTRMAPTHSVQRGPGARCCTADIFSATGGQYTLKSTTMNWTDSGTYQLLKPSMMQATGRLGTGLWQRKGSAARPVPQRQPSAQQQEAMGDASNNEPGQIDV